MLMNTIDINPYGEREKHTVNWGSNAKQLISYPCMNETSFSVKRTVSRIFVIRTDHRRQRCEWCTWNIIDFLIFPLRERVLIVAEDIQLHRRSKTHRERDFVSAMSSIEFTDVGSVKCTRVPEEKAPNVNCVRWRLADIRPLDVVWLAAPKPGFVRRNGVKLAVRPVKFFTMMKIYPVNN